MKKQKIYGFILAIASGIAGLLGSLTPAVVLMPIALCLMFSKENLMY